MNWRLIDADNVFPSDNILFINCYRTWINNQLHDINLILLTKDKKVDNKNTFLNVHNLD